MGGRGKAEGKEGGGIGRSSAPLVVTALLLYRKLPIYPASHMSLFM